MKSDLKNKYENYDCTEESLSTYDSDIDIPINWSFVCLDETIDYYADCNNKISNTNVANKS